MKLIRLTDDRYILDAGDAIAAAQVEEIRHYWEDWWKTHSEFPQAIVIGGNREPLIYEDRRDADIENRVKALEQWMRTHAHVTGLDKSGPPLPHTTRPDPGKESS